MAQDKIAELYQKVDETFGAFCYAIQEYNKAVPVEDQIKPPSSSMIE